MVALSVPKKFYITASGTPYFKEASAPSTPNVEQDLIVVSVPAGKVRNLQQVVVACRMEGKFRILVGGELKGSGRTGAAEPNASFCWTPAMPVAAGVEIKVVFKQRNNSPPVDVEAYLQASDVAAAP